MKFVFAGLALASTAVFGSFALAHEHNHERVAHYEAAIPASVAEALKVLDEKNTEIGNLLAQPKLDNNALEAIHQKTYAMEAALKTLEKNDRDDDIREHALDAADDAVEELHEASEHHNEASVRRWYKALQPSLQLVKDAFTGA